MTWGQLGTWRGRAVDRYFSWFGLHMSLAFKLAGPVLVTTAVLATVVGWVVTNQVQTVVMNAYDQQAELVSAGVGAMYAQHPGDQAQVNDYLARLVRSRSDLISVRILGLDAQTAVIASSNSAEVGVGGYADPAERQAIWDGRRFETLNRESDLVSIYPLKENDTLFGAIVITSSQSPELAAVRTITVDIGIAALVSIVVESVFVLTTLYLGVIRRTRRMQRAVEAVGRGDTTVRLPEGVEAKGRDEIFNLARSVDHMIETLDERQRGDQLIRLMSRRALEGVPSTTLVSEGLAATRVAMGLDSCLFVSLSEGGEMMSWLDSSTSENKAPALPVWIFALTHVAVEARRTIVTDRLGQHSRFADEAGVASEAQAAIVPLPRTSKAGQAIIAIAAAGETLQDRGLAVLDAVAATMSESLHMQAAENARAESAVKSRVMSAVSHEMRNPLNSILGFTALVLGAPAPTLTDKQRRQLGYVQSSAQTMLTLVNNYLDLAKVRAGSVTLQYETMKVASLVTDVAALMQPAADSKNVTIRTAVSPDAEARIDPVRVRQVLTNLISNAVKFTPSGGRVYVRARADDRQIRFAVSDTGVGIPKDQQKLLFSEFAKIDAASLAGAKGTGLGLALTRAFVMAMGGTIRAYSRRGRGTTFVVVLPRPQAADRRVSAA